MIYPFLSSFSTDFSQEERPDPVYDARVFPVMEGEVDFSSRWSLGTPSAWAIGRL